MDDILIDNIKKVIIGSNDLSLLPLVKRLINEHVEVRIVGFNVSPAFPCRIIQLDRSCLL